MKPAHDLVLAAWGKRVRTARKGLSLTQVAAAERCGIDQSTLSRVETGDYKRVTPELILRLCVGLGLDPENTFEWPPAIVEIAKMRTGAAA